MKMDPLLKKRWINALRSQRYQQGHWCLKSLDKKYCCLGVLADVIDPTAWIGNRNEFSWKGDMLSLPRDILSNETQLELIGMNDNYVSFSKIADWIEANL